MAVGGNQQFRDPTGQPVKPGPHTCGEDHVVAARCNVGRPPGSTAERVVGRGAVPRFSLDDVRRRGAGGRGVEKAGGLPGPQPTGLRGWGRVGRRAGPRCGPAPVGRSRCGPPPTTGPRLCSSEGEGVAIAGGTLLGKCKQAAGWARGQQASYGVSQVRQQPCSRIPHPASRDWRWGQCCLCLS